MKIDTGSAALSQGQHKVDATLQEAGRSFERLLIEQMLRSMEASIDGGLFGKEDTGSEWYTAMFNQEMSRSLSADGGFGLADRLLEQMQRERVGRSSAEDGIARYHGVARTPLARYSQPPPERIAELTELVERVAGELGVDGQLAAALVQQESGWDARARSVRGAMGLSQLMPDTARALGVEDPWDPEQNLRGGLSYLKQQLEAFGDTGLALAAYNAGPEAVHRHGGLPPYEETRDYVARILSRLEEQP